MSISARIVKRVPGFELDVAWDIADELAVLFGYSGSGKSMTLAALAGLVRPDAGRITCNGRVLFDSLAAIDERPQNRPFGYVTQGCTLFPHMTVRGNIEYALRELPRKARPERVDQMATALQLHGLLQKRPAELSGGQKQRAQFARALARRPHALLLDEPFTALDAPIRAEMRELVRQVREEFGMPVILVTHDLYEAYTLADRMIVYGGEGVVRVGTPCELFKDPGTPQIEALLSGERLFMCG
ncbi:MAG: ATP-binding cassette domain-containing protein [Actinobacteria bacterium]|nr:ATP-binding cassette domain-containing protein [Actinomycetota bacterium]MCG2808300.1 ATP-binding cassette domain-containing protein [Coriobacteriia bacterium]